MKKAITAMFMGGPGDLKEQECDKIFAKYKGKEVGRGTFLPTMTRDIQYYIPDKHVAACVAALKAAGCEVEIADEADLEE